MTASYHPELDPEAAERQRELRRQIARKQAQKLFAATVENVFDAGVTLNEHTHEWEKAS